jgi:AraC-like DNA-binding protein
MSEQLCEAEQAAISSVGATKMSEELFSAHFTTAELPEADRLAAHREFFKNAMGPVDIQAVGDAPFHGKLRLSAVPGFGVASVFTSPTTVGRRPALSNETEESVFFLLVRPGSGAYQVTHGNREIDIGNGEAVVLRGNEPISGINETARVDTFRMPVSLFDHLLADFDGAVGRSVPASAPALSLLASYLETIHDELPRSPALRHLAPLHMRDLTTVFMGATRDAEMQAMGRGVAAARLRAIKLDMARHLQRADLTAERVGRDHKVSARYVQKLFERDGTTFNNYLSGLRLEEARRRISNPELAHLPITEIVFDAGFNDLSTFYRLFRKRFDATPSDLRAAAFEPGTP